MLRRAIPAGRRVRGSLAPLAALLVAIGLSVPVVVAAQVTWQAPAGGETWTAGTQHTVAWSGGPGTVFGLIAYGAPPLVNFTPILGGPFANLGYASWSIPPTLPPGTYTIQIAFTDGSSYVSPEFTIQAPPECLPACQTVSFSFPAANPYFPQPPVGICGTSAHGAGLLAEAFFQQQLAEQCFEGYSLDPGSVVMDLTILPAGVCWAGTGGAFVAEVSGFGCCCADPVPAGGESWGQLKSRYR